MSNQGGNGGVQIGNGYHKGSSWSQEVGRVNDSVTIGSGMGQGLGPTSKATTPNTLHECHGKSLKGHARLGVEQNKNQCIIFLVLREAHKEKGAKLSRETINAMKTQMSNPITRKDKRAKRVKQWAFQVETTLNPKWSTWMLIDLSWCNFYWKTIPSSGGWHKRMLNQT